MTTKNDIKRIAGSLAVLGTELEQKGKTAWEVLEGWEQGPRRAPRDERDGEVCECHHTAATHYLDRGPCSATVSIVDEETATTWVTEGCTCGGFKAAQSDPAAEDRSQQLAEARRAARHHALYREDLDIIDAAAQRIFRRLDMACPPDMEELRNRRTGEFDPETATDAMQAGWCPNCWQVDQAHVPLTVNTKGFKYYSDRCRPCGDFRTEYGIDKPREIVAGHLASPPRRFTSAEFETIIARAKAAAAPPKKGKKGKRSKKGRVAA
jgi:hypothetical protein